LDAVLKTAYDYSYLGFSSGTFLGAGGEAHGPAHIQIGTNAPTKLWLTVMRYFNGTYWLPMNVQYETPDDPYTSGKTSPNTDDFWDQTGAH